MRSRDTCTAAAPNEEVRLSIRRLIVRRGEREVVRDASLDVARGEVVGLLGPNGAGKSSALLAIIGLIPAAAGRIVLDGEDLPPGHPRIRERAGVVFQDPALDGRLGARANLRLAAGLHGVGGARARERVEAALAVADIPGREDDPVSRLSGGMRRRVELVRALVHEPDVLLMDEPTTGLDEASFRRVWDVLRERTETRGVAVLLTTHREQEAERCDRLVVIHGGRVVADDTPEALRRGVGGDVLEMQVEDAVDAAATLEVALGPAFGIRATALGDRVRIVTERGHELVPRVVEALPRGALRSLTVRRPGLADAYLALTGEGLRVPETAS